MKKKHLYLSILIFFIVIVLFIIVRFINHNFNQYNEIELNRMITELEKKGYTIKEQDVDKDILVGKRKWLTINDEEHISVYIYRNKKHMNKDAARVSLDGSGYNGNFSKLEVCWISYPHFYKKDNIIVLYVGENKELIKILDELFNHQFAGYKG